MEDGRSRLAAEFFAGAGLVRRAMEGAGWRVVWANDFDPVKRRVYRAWLGDDHEIDGRDVREVRAGDVPEAALWTASFPCTDLSVAGGRAGIHAGQSEAVWAILRMLREKGEQGPRWVLFENVTGLLSSHAGADLRALVGALNGAGFGVDPMLVDARWFTPQSRPRLFLLASRLGEAARADPMSLAPRRARPARVVEAMRAHADLVWHARDLPEPPAGAARVESVLESLDDDDARWWSEERVRYFLAQAHPAHHALRDEVCARGGVATAFRRVRQIGGVKRSVVELRADGCAGCLRMPKGGSAKQMLLVGRRGAPARVRYMTAVECARLQGVEGVPDGFTESELLAAMGDAVCVPAARWALERIDQPSPAVVCAPASRSRASMRAR